MKFTKIYFHFTQYKKYKLLKVLNVQRSMIARNMAAIYNQVSPSPSLYFTHLISGSSFYENIAHKFRYSSFLYDNFQNGLILEYIKYMSNVWILFYIWYSYCPQTDENSTTNKIVDFKSLAVWLAISIQKLFCLVPLYFTILYCTHYIIIHTSTKHWTTISK